MPEPSVLLAFAGSFFLIALSPGICMTLALSMGIRLGVRRTLWMMAGELLGVALVSIAAIIGVGALLLQAPTAFASLKIGGAMYLFHAGWQSWRSEPVDPARVDRASCGRVSLVLQGFIAAVANPKAWAFFIALLPPFVDRSLPLRPQLLALLALIILIEFGCLMIYAAGGRRLGRCLFSRGHGRWLNRISALMMGGVGLWLLLGG